MAYNTPYTEDAVDASITVGDDDEAGGRTIDIQLKDATGANMDSISLVELTLYLDAGGVDYAVTGGSTGIAAGAAGKVLAALAKKNFRALTNSSGLLSLTWLDEDNETAFLGVKLPNGHRIMSSELTVAAVVP